jgi:hypothetical protein
MEYKRHQEEFGSLGYLLLGFYSEDRVSPFHKLRFSYQPTETPGIRSAGTWGVFRRFPNHREHHLPDLVHPLTFITFSSPYPLNPEPPVVSQQAVSFSATLISQILICTVPLPFFCSFHSFQSTSPKLQNHRNTYLNHQTPNLLPTVSHPNRHITQHRRMSNIRSIGIALDVRCPFEFRRVSVSRTHIPCLELLELLLGAELVCLL